MSKESRTEKETSRLLAILGDNPHRRVKYFLGFVIILGGLIWGAIFLLNKNKKTPKGVTQKNCSSMGKKFAIDYLFLNKSLAAKRWEQCESKFGIPLKDIVEQVCVETFKKSLTTVRVDLVYKEARTLNSLETKCGNIFESYYDEVENKIQINITNTTEILNDYKGRAESNSNVAIEKAIIKQQKKLDIHRRQQEDFNNLRAALKGK